MLGSLKKYITIKKNKCPYCRSEIFQNDKIVTLKFNKKSKSVHTGCLSGYCKKKKFIIEELTVTNVVKDTESNFLSTFHYEITNPVLFGNADKASITIGHNSEINYDQWHEGVVKKQLIIRSLGYDSFDLFCMAAGADLNSELWKQFKERVDCVIPVLCTK